MLSEEQITSDIFDDEELSKERRTSDKFEDEDLLEDESFPKNEWTRVIKDRALIPS